MTNPDRHPGPPPRMTTSDLTLFTPPDRRTGERWNSDGRNGIGGHTRPNDGGTDVWLTPPAIIDHLGPFDLDPCAAPEPRPWDTATEPWAPPEHDGLNDPWVTAMNPNPFVWLNPPYGRDVGAWLERLAEHGNGIALTFARTETAAFRDAVWGRASGLLFISGRLHFHHPDGRRASMNAGGPSVLIAYGPAAAHRLARHNRTLGAWVTEPSSQAILS